MWIDDLVECVDCRAILTERETWHGGRCEACAVRADPCACPECKGRGVVYQAARDKTGCLIRRLTACPACGGEG